MLALSFSHSHVRAIVAYRRATGGFVRGSVRVGGCWMRMVMVNLLGGWGPAFRSFFFLLRALLPDVLDGAGRRSCARVLVTGKALGTYNHPTSPLPPRNSSGGDRDSDS